MLVIKCYSCGSTKPFDGEISTRKDLEAAISQTGFMKLVDDYRTVAVCSPKCASPLLTKRGQLLKRLPEAYSVGK
jgi:hypothetical protein